MLLSNGKANYAIEDNVRGLGTLTALTANNLIDSYGGRDLSMEVWAFLQVSESTLLSRVVYEALVHSTIDRSIPTSLDKFLR
jgi:hypothetical protein